MNKKEQGLPDGASVVVEDCGDLQLLCGPHDENLGIIETCLDRPVRVRGNEVHIDAQDAETAERFRSLVDGLLALAAEGRHLDPELVRSVCESLVEDRGHVERLGDSAIVIPQGFQKVLPRSPAQAQFVRDLGRYDMIFGIGPAGTGKTFLAIAHALAEILSHRRRKLILTRPVVEAGESLGFLPGDLEEKLNPYVRPLYDAMDALVPPEVISRLQDSRVIEIAPLAYMRGRSLKDCVVILDEAQNATREQMKMFLTRMGEGTRVIVTGDITQIDLPGSRQSGLIHAMKVLEGIKEIKFSYFSSRDVVRSRLVRSIIKAYDAYEERMNP